MTHYHIQVIDGGKDYTYSNTSFAWTLARCAVLMELDGLLRKPFQCDGSGKCLEHVSSNMYKVKGLIDGARTNSG